MAADSTYAQIHRRIVESGEWDRIYAALVARLSELGWIDTLRSSAKDHAHHMRFRDLLAELEDQCNSSIPLSVRQEIMQMIRIFVEKQFD
ncbi:SUS1 [Sanghuangporus sanghuang]